MTVKTPLSVAIKLVLLALLFACQPKQTEQVSYQAPQCIEGQSECQVVLPIGNAGVSFNLARITAETPFDIVVTIESAADITKVSGYLEGVNMYMGKIPLFSNEMVKSDDENSLNVVFNTQLGSCAAPQMRWQAWLVVEYLDDSNKAQETRFSIEFPSYQY